MNDEDKRSEPREPKNTTASVEKAAADKWTALERAKTEKALPDSEEKYKLLFNSMDEGYCIIQILYDGSGKPCDFRYLEVNPAFERHNGLSGATGKTIRELTPAIESKWIDIYAQIAESGKSLRFVEDSDALHRIFDLYAFRIGKAEERKIAVLFIDITKRKKAEQFQRESEDRKTYLLRLSDALRSLSDLMEIKQEALRQAGNYLDLDRLMYSEPGAGLTSYTIYANYVRKGFALHTGRFAMDPLSPSGKSMHQGEIDIVCDVAKDKRLSAAEKETLFSLKVQAYVTVPLLRKGKWVCNLIAHSSHVHNWTSFEISILEETADRTWTELERARAKLALHDLNETLEQRVQERTRQLIELKLEQEKEKLNAVIFAQEEERTRIAEGLHNGVAQLLYAVQNKLQVVEPLEGKKKRAFDSALATLSDAIRDTRNISFELMPPVLNDYGLNVAIETFIKRLSERDNMHFNLHINLAGRLSEKLEVSLYRIVQEIIGNIVKHSGANNATIAITTTNKYIKLNAEDNGIAFSVLQVKRSGKGIGLKSIENRVKLLNGKLKIKSMPGHGTVIKISLPANGELI